MLAFNRSSLLGAATLFLIAGCSSSGEGDKTPPDVIAPADITVEATGPGGVPASQVDIVAFLAGSSATDLEDPNPTLSQNAPAIFPLGPTVVNFTYTDDDGNRGSASATVTVVDTVAPVVTAPANIAVEAPGTAAINTFLVASSSTDLVDLAPVVTTDAPARFPLGETTVTFTHTDGSGNFGTASATVTVSDTVAPGVTAPAAITAEAASASGTPSSASAISAFLNASSADDAGDPNPTLTQNAPAVFPLGTTDVTFIYTDWAGNSSNATSSVTVVDTTPPTVSAPADITVEADGPGGTPASDAGIVAFLGASSATDAVDPSPTLAKDAPSTFPLGATLVTFTYTDANGNEGTDSATVTVADTTSPVVTAPADITVEADSPAGLVASDPTISAFLSGSSAIDSVDAAPVVSDDAPSTFPLGATVVTFTYTDASGNAGSQTATVNVVDTVAPMVTAPGDITVEAVSAAGTPASDTGITAFLAGASATDAVDTSPVLSDDAPETFPLGDTLVTFTFTDASGNTASATATASVVDTTPPVISLIGSNPLTVLLNSIYIDAGANVSDIVDTALSATSTGVVDTSIVGSYFINYTAEDSAGNEAIVVTREVIVEVGTPSGVGFTVAPNQLNFTWDPSTAQNKYRISQNPDGASGFAVVQGANNIGPTETGYNLDIPVHLTDWVNAQFIVEACNTDESQCRSSTIQTVSISDSIDAIVQEKASRLQPGSFFGWQVAMSGDGNTLAVGVPFDGNSASGINGSGTVTGGNNRSGAVYVFVKEDNVWTEQAYIKAAFPDPRDDFGHGVALSHDGNTLIVGAPGEESNATGINGDQTLNTGSDYGAVYEFTRSANLWTQTTYIKPLVISAITITGGFGRAVAISDDGNTMAIGNALLINDVYVFVKSNNVWSQQEILQPPGGGDNDSFGGTLNSISLSEDGNVIAIAALANDSDAIGIGLDDSNNNSAASGAVYTFTRSGSTWSFEEFFKASNSDPFDNFGTSVSLSDDGIVLAVGASAERSISAIINGDQNDNTALTSGGRSAGAVYLFNKESGSWLQEAYIKPSNNNGFLFGFGVSVSLNADGSLLAVGAPSSNGPSPGVSTTGLDAVGGNGTRAGAAYIYSSSNGSWEEINLIKNKDAIGNFEFGNSVSLSDDGLSLAVGASLEDTDATGALNSNFIDSGAVYLY